MSSKNVRRVAVITGASSGIGLATAKALVGEGWHVIAQGRDAARSAAAEASIRKAGADDRQLNFLRANLSMMSETKQLADEVKTLTDRIDVLINNAGGVRDQRYVTSEGLEETFAANHLAPFLLTRELLPLLTRTAATSNPGEVRVLAVSSQAYLHVPGMNWDDLQYLEGEFPTGPAYCQAKLANQLFSLELNSRLADHGIVSQALVPGPVTTNFANHGDEAMQSFMQSVEGLSPEEVARTVVWMATARETGAPGGRMFYDMKEVPVEAQGRDTAAAARLWEESERLLAAVGR